MGVLIVVLIIVLGSLLKTGPVNRKVSVRRGKGRSH